MPKITTDDRGQLILPEEVRQRQRITPQAEYWLEEREGDLILQVQNQPVGSVREFKAVMGKVSFKKGVTLFARSPSGGVSMSIL